MRRTLLLCVLVAVAVAAVSVSVSAGSGKSGRATTIAVVPKGTTHEFWKSVHAGAVKAGRELGVEILWQGPLKEDDREDQIKVVDTLVSRGIDGMLLAPLDDKALRQPVANAVRAGIPVVTFDSKLESDDPVSLVSTSNLGAGRLAGKHLGEILGGKGNVIMMRLHEGSASTTDREQGFMETIATFPGITVVSSNQYAGALAEGGYRTGENLLASTRAAQGNVQGMKDGHIDGLVLQNPFAMGYIGIKTLVAHIRGEKVEKFIDTGAAVVTLENMNEPDIKERLQPDLDKYLK
jgi:ribose transport system substrate-binding protein